MRELELIIALELPFDFFLLFILVFFQYKHTELIKVYKRSWNLLLL